MSQSAHNTSLTEHMNARYRDFIFFFNKKGPAADATDAPQPKGLLCNPVMKRKMINFFHFSK
jgi:hypothetical protein